MGYAFGDFELDVSSWELRERGEIVPAQPKVLGVLLYLIRNRDRVVSRQELLDAVWPAVKVGPNSVVQAIASVRRILRDEDDSIVRTIQTRGYRFVATVERQHEAALPSSEASAGAIVGRHGVLERLSSRLEQARAGKGDIVVVTGPVGIGKSCVVRELVRRASERGIRVRSVACYEGETQLLLPWQRLVGSVDGDDAAPTPIDFETAGGDPFQLFERVRQWLERCARQSSPFVIVLEDLNWSDPPSLLLLKFLARDIAKLPVLIVATYRDAPIDAALARVLGTICREDPSRRIELKGLDLEATAELGRQIVGPGASPALIEQTWRKTAGNPLFLTQLFHVMGMAEGEAPSSQLTSTLLAKETVREAIAEHLAPLTTDCKSALSVAALLGTVFRLDALTQTLSCDPSSLLGLLDEACGARVISPLPKSRNAFCFRHEVVRDVMYRKLSPSEKVRWHRAAGDALSELFDAGSIDDPLLAAEHFVQGAAGGRVDVAAEWLAETARGAWKAGRFEQAVGLMERAFELTAPPFAIVPELTESIAATLAKWTELDPERAALLLLAERFQRRIGAGKPKSESGVTA